MMRDYIGIGLQEDEESKHMSCCLEVQCAADIKKALQLAISDGYGIIVTYIVHPGFSRNLLVTDSPYVISRTDRLLSNRSWSTSIVTKLTPTINVDSEIEEVARQSRALLNQELGFAAYLGLPAIMLSLTQKQNRNLAGVLYNKLVSGVMYQVWIDLPMVHRSRYSPIFNDDEREDMWEWWNIFRTYCHYDQKLGLALQLPEVKYLPTDQEIDRWIGEPVKAIIIHTSLFITDNLKRILPKVYEDIIQKFMSFDIKYIIRGPSRAANNSYKCYWDYINSLREKFGRIDDTTQPTIGLPMKPLSTNLQSEMYEEIERDKIKYIEYQNAIQKALEELPSETETPVVMVVGAGRGPLVQACLNTSYILQRKIKLYAVEKNPFAISTLESRVQNEWKNQVILINQDMRTYEPPEKADILVSELLGSFGDNELSPECLDGAQRFLKQSGISIPSSYTSFLAPLQSIKIYNEIRSTRLPDMTIESIYEIPYVAHLVNYYQLAPSKQLYSFDHPNWRENIDNERYGRLRFTASQDCVLTGFVGYFETVLYKKIMLSINPQTFSEKLIGWSPIVFSLGEPVHIKKDDIIKVCFWRMQSEDRVWYQWCLESPIRTSIMNPNGRSFYINKY